MIKMISDKQMMAELLYCAVDQGYYIEIEDSINIELQAYMSLIKIVGEEIGKTVYYER